MVFCKDRILFSGLVLLLLDLELLSLVCLVCRYDLALGMTDFFDDVFDFFEEDEALNFLAIILAPF